LSIILDCSVTLAWYLPDEFDLHSQSILKLVGSKGGVVTYHWRTEMANGLLTALRRERIELSFLKSAFDGIDALPLTTDLDGQGRTDERLVRFALDERLTVYDAIYLEAAVRLRLPLATFDKALARAAKSNDVQVLGPYA